MIILKSIVLLLRVKVIIIIRLSIFDKTISIAIIKTHKITLIFDQSNLNYPVKITHYLLCILNLEITNQRVPSNVTFAKAKTTIKI